MAVQTPNMGLTTWDSLTDNFSHTDLRANFVAIDNHDHTAGKGVPIGAGAIANLAIGQAQLQDGSVTNGKVAIGAGITRSKLNFGTGLTNADLATGAAIARSKLDFGTGLTNADLVAGAGILPSKLASGITFTGAANITGPDTRTNTAYGTLPTPDQVTGVVLPTNGLIALVYQATWQESVSGAARAAIFLGTNQLKAYQNSSPSAPVVADSGARTAAANTDNVLASWGLGLFTVDQGTAYTGNVTTGQVAGSVSGAPFCLIFAAAGTYTVSVQFKSSSGSVTARDRKLWVAALTF